MDSRRQIQALGLAFLLELGLLTGVAFALTNMSTTKPAISGSESISLVEEAVQPNTQPKPQPPKPKPPKPKLPEPKPPEPKPVVAPTPPKPEIPQVAEAQANAFTEPAPPPVPEAGKAPPSAEYVAKIHAAVQSATYYPPAASSLRYEGRVRVEFHLLDQVPSAIQILEASGIGMIDRAALQAIHDARYPEPPAEMRGVDHVFQVWVEFHRKL